ncbi:putative PAP/25A-associated, Nucleotidyltransferase superfamily [Septoria linicola]|nr:putative PAP/25A-associated, Nucleotidyltransferase superfamily [Septoria linicola]
MAGLPNGSRFEQQPARTSISRPGIVSHTSSSVPSTPLQKPRDLGRFHSRSPSPHRGLANQSPHSVASEAVDNQKSSRTNTGVCAFESGSEFRKRRIPYVDGGNEELGPPKKEPKKTLQPDEQTKLSADMRYLYDMLLPDMDSEQRRQKLITKLERILKEKWPGHDIRVNVFGSSGNLLSTRDSDVDICITTDLKLLQSMHSLAEVLNNNGMTNVVCRPNAKVPIVKCWDPELRLSVDLNVNNSLALQNTRMIKTYVQLDKRVRPLAKIIKHWTKCRILNDAAYGGTISSYTWICMIINFLQRRNPPILPSLQKITDCRTKLESGEPSPFADDVEALKRKGLGKENTESLGELLFQFFRHYGYEFDFSKYVVCVREGRAVSRKEKGWDPRINYQDKESRVRLCVEEPFTQDRNLGNSADDYAWYGIHQEIRRAFDLLEDGLQLAKCCEEFVFPPEPERPLFQRPPPKPKPTLTRSASQTNRSNQDSGSSRSRKNNRNQSGQRAGNRRASSGAAYSHHRAGLPYSPSGGNPADYFAVKGGLHEQLFQQYQFLQAQQDALRHQLERQQQQVATSRGSDLAGSPRPRQYANGLASPRFADYPPQSAPLLPGYLYHYPAAPRYPPPSPMSQARQREGTNTNPSSPSLVPALPALRRNVHRASVPDTSASAVRSQSQPGRSLPHPLTLQQHVHPGYDVSGALGGQRSVSQVHAGYPGLQLPLSAQFPGVHPVGHAFDSAMPKEYVGYFSSPQLGPQQYSSPGQMPPHVMTLRDPPPRQRRVTPDLAPPVLNGRHTSRSPSPLGQLRGLALNGDVTAGPAHIVQSPTPNGQSYVAASLPPASLPISAPVLVNGSSNGPVIVNGSTRSMAPKPIEQILTNGIARSGIQLQNEVPFVTQPEDLSRYRPQPLRTGFDPSGLERRTSDSEALSPTQKPVPDRRTSLSPNGTHLNGVNGHHHELAPMQPLAAPMLSPVAELRTPSPTHAKAFDHDSPKVNGLLKKAQLAEAKQALLESQPPKSGMKPGHERRGSAPTSSSSATTASNGKAQPTQNLAMNMPTPKPHEWQMASGGKKQHKKNKSTASVKGANGSGGQPLPVNELERKGG